MINCTPEDAEAFLLKTAIECARLDEEQAEILVTYVSNTGQCMVWVDGLRAILDLEDDGSDENRRLILQRASTQLLLQFESTKGAKSSAKSVDRTLESIGAFSRGLIFFLIERYIEKGINLAELLIRDLERYCYTHAIDHLEKIVAFLGLNKAKQLGEALLSDHFGEQNRYDESFVVSKVETSFPKVYWNDDNAGLTKLANYLHNDLEWIKGTEAWGKFFDENCDELVVVVCKRSAKEQVGMLIQLLYYSDRIKLQQTKGLWQMIMNSFVDENGQALCGDWAKMVSKAKKSPKMKAFKRNVEPILVFLGIVKEDFVQKFGEF